MTAYKYTFKYLNPNEMVYVIRRCKHTFYSEPYNNNRGNVRNAVVAYKDSVICDRKMKDIVGGAYIEKVQLIDLEGTCAELQMPLNVVLNEFCDINDRFEYKEIFFFENKEDDEFTMKKLYMK